MCSVQVFGGWVEVDEKCGHVPYNVNDTRFSCVGKPVGFECQRLVVDSDIYCKDTASTIARCITEVFYNALGEPVPQAFGGTLLKGACNASGYCAGMTSTAVIVMSDTRTKQGANCENQ